ncbi:PAS domain-containing protein [Pelotalea chapellei]|uniref:histidine kinase n=1 Tax=Pelotalea chapellei TaxID=44671 RepID=A0ABS5UAY8_9BACT|nr:PAS domain-containing protein [Pelotalea chapellei]MBT1072847.1 PAS domain S-box protein [Pelotalea chapellei]
MRTTTKLIASNCLITLLMIVVFAMFSLNRFYAEDLHQEHKNLEKCIMTFWEFYKYKGTEFKSVGGQLLIGDHVVNANFEVPDKIQKIFGGVATVFMGDIRVSTNVMDDEGKRAVGTRLIGPAYSAVFGEGRPYRGEAIILGHPYLTAYDPIKDHSGKVIGALFVGVKKVSFQEKFDQIKTPIMIMLAVLLISFAIATFLLLKLTRRIERTEANSLNFLKTLMETIPSPIFYKDAKGRYLGFNKAYEEYVGMRQEQLIGKTCFDLWPRDLAERYHQQDQTLFENQGIQKYEGSMVSADGARHDVIFYKAPFHSQQGAVEGLVGVILDITERKAAEEEIKNAYQQLNDIIEFLPDATFVVDKDKRVIAWNLAIEKMTGVGKDEVMGKGDYAYAEPFYGERRPILIDLIDADLEKINADELYPYIKKVGRTLFTETCIPSVNGRESRYIWGTAAPLFDKLGNRVGGIESMRDITEYKRVEDELRFRNLLLSTQLNSSIDGILAVDQHFKIISYNKRFLELTHIPPSLLETGLHGPVINAVAELAEDPQGFQIKVSSIYENQDTSSRDEIAFKGGVIIDRYSASMVDEDGKYYGRIWYFRDITDQKHAEEVRLRLEAQRHHSRMMETFVTQLGHDLKTPITPLFALIPLIKEKIVDPDLKRMVEICGKSIAAINELTEKALKLVKLSISTTGLLEYIKLAGIVEASIHSNRDILDQKKIRCENDIEPELVVVAVADQLIELFNNLITNAVHHSQTGEVVQIGARQTGNTITIAVRDNGIGVDPADLENIFDEFFKVDRSRHDLDSPGLGLSICRRIIANHHGTIWAESEGKGFGMTVFFTLPLQ